MPNEVEASLICPCREIPRLRCVPLGMTKASLEKTQSYPCKIRARGLTTIPTIEECNVQRSTRLSNATAQPALNALTKFKSSHSIRGFSEHGAISRTAFHFRRHAGL